MSDTVLALLTQTRYISTWCWKNINPIRGK